MLDGEKVFARAEAAVRIEITAIRPDLKGRWRPVVPKDVGLEPDDWLLASDRIVTRFSDSIGRPVGMTDPERAQYRTKRLIEFVVALADRGDTQIQAFSATFKVAGK
jgi:hypothetical protein